MEANPGRVVTIEDDVLGIKRRIEQRWPDLRVYIDKDNIENGYPGFIVAEIRKDGEEELVGEYEWLDERLIQRLEQADQWRVGNDVVKLMDALDAVAQREQDHKLSEAIGDATERMAHALVKDGVITKSKVFVSNRPT